MKLNHTLKLYHRQTNTHDLNQNWIDSNRFESNRTDQMSIMQSDKKQFILSLISSYASQCIQIEHCWHIHGNSQCFVLKRAIERNRFE